MGRIGKPGSRKGRRSISLTIQDDSEPSSKKMKAEVNAIDQSTQSTSMTMEQGVEKEKQKQNSANDIWNQDLTGELIPRPMNRQGKVLNVLTKKISIKLDKQKVSEKTQETKVVDLVKNADPNEKIRLMPTTVEMKQENSNAMCAEAVIKNLSNTMQFIEKQQKNL